MEEESTIKNHSFSNSTQVRTKHLSLELRVDFMSKTLKGVARHQIEHLDKAKNFIVDTKNLSILKVTTGKNNESEVDYRLEKSDSILGTPLIINITKKDEYINIYYKTNADSEALGWLDSAQTMTGKPFLYTQGEAILTRSWIPLQDVPSNKFTYDAKIKVPTDLLALMSAENPQAKNNSGNYSFKMNLPISSYLIALTVGDLSFRKVSGNTGVYAETPWVDKVKTEMEEMSWMLTQAEQLCGKYVWGRYDVVVLPYSFPFGGMENPCLTFLNPTVIVGDKSLTSVTAHELAHSWSGNLVTNQTWEDFWINEGWTVYLEHRIMERLKGRDFSDMLSIIEWQEYMREKVYYEKENKKYLLALKPNLKDKNPDDGMTSVPYGRGAFFFKTIEEKVGRNHFDAFIKKYFAKFRFQTINTDVFLAYLRKEIKGIDKLVKLDEWVYGSDIPTDAYVAKTDRIQEMEMLARYVAKLKTLPMTIYFNKKKYSLKREDFTTQEWLQFLRSMPRTISHKMMKDLNDRVGFTTWLNAEIQTEWFLLAIDMDHRAAFYSLEKFLGKVGRRKFLEPLYIRLSESPENKKWAQTVFDKSKAAYHSVSIETIKGILQ